MPNARTLTFSLLAALVCIVAPACSSEQPLLSPSPPGVVKIVSSLPSRGATAERTREISAAITLAIQERGRTAGGFDVEYVPLEGGDDETGDWSPQRELSNATAAANDRSVIAYIGPYTSGAVMVSLPVTNRASLLEASPSASWPGLTLSGWNPDEPNGYYPTGERTFVRLMPPDSAQADAAVKWARELGFTTATVLDDGSSYSNGLADEFEHAAATNSLSVTARLQIDPKALSSGGAPSAIKSGLLFYAPSSTSSAALLARVLVGTQAVVIATDTALEPQFIDDAGQNAVANWRIVSNSRQPDKASMFASAVEPDRTFPSQFAANAFDLTALVIKALDSGVGRNRGAVVKSVLQATAPGSGGRRLFNDAGDPEMELLSGYLWNGSSFTLDRTFELEP